MADGAIIDCFKTVDRRLGGWKTWQMARCLPRSDGKGHWDDRLLRRMATDTEPAPLILRRWLEALAEALDKPQPNEDVAPPMKREELLDLQQAMGGWEDWQVASATGLSEAELRVALPPRISARLRALRGLAMLGPRVSKVAWQQLMAWRARDSEEKEKLFARQDKRRAQKTAKDWERSKVKTMDFEAVAARNPLNDTAGRVVAKGEDEKRTTPVGYARR